MLKFVCRYVRKATVPFLHDIMCISLFHLAMNQYARHKCLQLHMHKIPVQFKYPVVIYQGKLHYFDHHKIFLAVFLIFK
jgi:hypothetical protein